MAGQTGSEAVLAAVRAKTIEQLVGQVGAAVTKEQEPEVAELHDRIVALVGDTPQAVIMAALLMLVSEIENEAAFQERVQ